MKAIKQDEVKRAKLMELQASTMAMRPILNALMPMVDAVSKGGDTALIEPMNVLTYLVLCKSSHLQCARRNLGRVAIGEEEISYD